MSCASWPSRELPRDASSDSVRASAPDGRRCARRPDAAGTWRAPPAVPSSADAGAGAVRPRASSREPVGPRPDARQPGGRARCAAGGRCGRWGASGRWSASSRGRGRCAAPGGPQRPHGAARGPLRPGAPVRAVHAAARDAPEGDAGRAGRAGGRRSATAARGSRSSVAARGRRSAARPDGPASAPPVSSSQPPPPPAGTPAPRLREGRSPRLLPAPPRGSQAPSLRPGHVRIASWDRPPAPPRFTPPAESQHVVPRQAEAPGGEPAPPAP